MFGIVVYPFQNSMIQMFRGGEGLRYIKIDFHDFEELRSLENALFPEMFT